VNATLFPELERPRGPLAERIRPRRLAEVIGHSKVLGEGGWLAGALGAGELPHLILWGPPGVGKTTIAALLAAEIGARYEAASAVQTGVADVRRILEEAAARWRREQRRTLFFLDEIHRFNRAQQDALLGDLERGTVMLVGATTENPAFALNAALLSRAQTLILGALGDADVEAILARALTHPHGLAATLDDEARASIVHAAEGDARFALGVLEAAAGSRPRVTAADVERVLAGNPLRHDRGGDRHYDVISALIKTMRAGDVDAAMYWAARMWDAGEDRRFLFRRLIIFAAEDVGNADLRGLPLAAAAADGFERVGEAEGWILFAQAVAFLAAAPKSKASYNAFKAAQALVARTGAPGVPNHLRNAPTALARRQGHGEGYHDPHSLPDAMWPEARHLPERVPEVELWQPTEFGDEAELARRVARFRARRAKSRSKPPAADQASE
jgi:putative ATPase